MCLTPEDCDEITRRQFDQFAVLKRFTTGPFKEDQSQEYGAPYIMPLWLFGELDTGQKVKAKRFD